MPTDSNILLYALAFYVPGQYRAGEVFRDETFIVGSIFHPLHYPGFPPLESPDIISRFHNLHSFKDFF